MVLIYKNNYLWQIFKPRMNNDAITFILVMHHISKLLTPYN